ncbi:MAG: M48 family metalloprotease [Alphaproteobacteria bacterium]|nr:M48 family metalloprotease [Alphaproteobacteria bacterium]
MADGPPRRGGARRFFRLSLPWRIRADADWQRDLDQARAWSERTWDVLRPRTVDRETMRGALTGEGRAERPIGPDERGRLEARLVDMRTVAGTVFVCHLVLCGALIAAADSLFSLAGAWAAASASPALLALWLRQDWALQRLRSGKPIGLAGVIASVPGRLAGLLGRERRPPHLVLLAALLTLAGCTLPPASWSPRDTLGADALELWMARERRLHQVAWPLLGQAAHCQARTRSVGLKVAEAGDLPPALAPLLTARAGADALTVIAVARFAPADGRLVPGDVIVAVDGVAVSPGATGHTDPRTGEERGEGARDVFARTMQQAGLTAAITVMRGNGMQTHHISTQQVCAWQIRLAPSDALTAWADRSGITITTGMMRYAESDDDLALVLAHEIAHTVIDDNARASRWPGLSRSARADLERRADWLGVMIAAAGGYDMSGAARFWRRLNAERARRPDPQAAVRALTIEAAVARLDELRGRR